MIFVPFFQPKENFTNVCPIPANKNTTEWLRVVLVSKIYRNLRYLYRIKIISAKADKNLLKIPIKDIPKVFCNCNFDSLLNNILGLY